MKIAIESRQNVRALEEVIDVWNRKPQWIVCKISNLHYLREGGGGGPMPPPP